MIIINSEMNEGGAATAFITPTASTLDGKTVKRLPLSEAQQLHRAWLLHRRPYKERSMIAELLVESIGRVAVVVQGVRTARSKYAAVLQPFHQLLVQFKGRGELKNLISAETTQLTFLTGERLFCGFYLNELLMRAMIHGQPLEDIGTLYQHTLQQLSGDAPLQPILRQFEFTLLELSGYLPVLECDSNSGEALQAGQCYQLVQELGLIPCQHDEQGYSAELLLALAQQDFSNLSYYNGFKQLMRQLLVPLIGTKPLQSRELFQSRRIIQPSHN